MKVRGSTSTAEYIVGVNFPDVSTSRIRWRAILGESSTRGTSMRSHFGRWWGGRVIVAVRKRERFRWLLGLRLRRVIWIRTSSRALMAICWRVAARRMGIMIPIWCFAIIVTLPVVVATLVIVGRIWLTTGIAMGKRYWRCSSLHVGYLIIISSSTPHVFMRKMRQSLIQIGFVGRCHVKNLFQICREERCCGKFWIKIIVS